MISRLSFLFFSFLGLATHISLASEASKKNAGAGYAAVQDRDIDAQDENRQTALIRAVIDEDRNKIRELLAQKANPDIQDKYNKTALLWALEAGYIEIADALLKAGAAVHLEDIQGVTPLMEAVRLNNKELTETIISALRNNAMVKVGDKKTVFDAKGFRESLNMRDRVGRTALMRVQDPEIARILITAGANIFMKDKNGKSIEAILQEKLSQKSSKKEAKKEIEERIKLAQKFPTLVAAQLTKEQQKELEERARTKATLEDEILLVVLGKKEEKEQALCRLAQKPDVLGVVQLLLEGVSPDTKCIDGGEITNYYDVAVAWSPEGRALPLGVDDTKPSVPRVLDAVLTALNDVTRQRVMSVDPTRLFSSQADADFSRILQAYKSIIQVLINNNAQLNYTVRGETPLDKVFAMMKEVARNGSRFKRPSIMENINSYEAKLYGIYQNVIKELIVINKMLEKAGAKVKLRVKEQAQLKTSSKK